MTKLVHKYTPQKAPLFLYDNLDTPLNPDYVNHVFKHKQITIQPTPYSLKVRLGVFTKTNSKTVQNIPIDQLKDLVDLLAKIFKLKDGINPKTNKKLSLLDVYWPNFPTHYVKHLITFFVSKPFKSITEDPILRVYDTQDFFSINITNVVSVNIPWKYVPSAMRYSTKPLDENKLVEFAFKYIIKVMTKTPPKIPQMRMVYKYIHNLPDTYNLKKTFKMPNTFPDEITPPQPQGKWKAGSSKSQFKTPSWADDDDFIDYSKPPKFSPDSDNFSDIDLDDIDLDTPSPKTSKPFWKSKSYQKTLQPGKEPKQPYYTAQEYFKPQFYDAPEPSPDRQFFDTLESPAKPFLPGGFPGAATTPPKRTPAKIPKPRKRLLRNSDGSWYDPEAWRNKQALKYKYSDPISKPKTQAPTPETLQATKDIQDILANLEKPKTQAPTPETLQATKDIQDILANLEKPKTQAPPQKPSFFDKITKYFSPPKTITPPSAPKSTAKNAFEQWATTAPQSAPKIPAYKIKKPSPIKTSSIKSRKQDTFSDIDLDDISDIDTSTPIKIATPKKVAAPKKATEAPKKSFTQSLYSSIFGEEKPAPKTSPPLSPDSLFGSESDEESEIALSPPPKKKKSTKKAPLPSPDSPIFDDSDEESDESPDTPNPPPKKKKSTKKALPSPDSPIFDDSDDESDKEDSPDSSIFGDSDEENDKEDSPDSSIFGDSDEESDKEDSPKRVNPSNIDFDIPVDEDDTPLLETPVLINEIPDTPETPKPKKKASPKKSSPKKRSAKKAASKKRSAKKSSPKRRSAKKAASKKRSAKKSSPKRRSAKKSSPKRRSTKKAAPKKRSAAPKKRSAKKAASKRRSAKKSSPKRRSAKKAASKKRSAKKAASKKRNVKKAASKKQSVKKAASKKRSAKKAASKKRSVKKAASKKQSVKKAASKKRSAKKAASKKRSAKKAASKKTAKKK